MQHNLKNILDLLQEGLEREQLVLESGLKKNKLSIAEQKGRIEGIELAILKTLVQCPDCRTVQHPNHDGDKIRCGHCGIVDDECAFPDFIY